MASDKIKVMYFVHASPALYDFARGLLPEGFDLVTLDEEDVEERRRKIRDCEAAIVGSYRLSREFVEAAPRLRLVQHQGVGYHDTVDLDALRERQIALALAPGGTSIGVSEHAIMLMLAVCKRLPYVDAELRQGRWHSSDLRAESRQLDGMTVGIVGLGRIGKEVARRLIGFRTTTLYHDIVDMPASVERECRARRVDLATLLRDSDIVTMHVPLTSATHRMIGTEALARMKPGAMLINCARGPVVDEAALVAALDSGRLGGAGLDVFEVEPPPQPTPLARFHNVVLTPHHAPGTRDAMRLKLQDAFANVARFFRGEPLNDRVVLS